MNPTMNDQLTLWTVAIFARALAAAEANQSNTARQIMDALLRVIRDDLRSLESLVRMQHEALKNMRTSNDYDYDARIAALAAFDKMQEEFK